MIYGKYVISSNGEILAESKNIITASGLTAINQFLVGNPAMKQWAGTMKIGASYTPVTSSDTALAYETFSAGTFNLAYLNTGSITMSAKFLNFVGEIYEIGIVPQVSFKPGTRISDFSVSIDSKAASSQWYSMGTGSAKLYALNDFTTKSRDGGFNSWLKTASAYYYANTPLSISTWVDTSGYLDFLYFVPSNSVGGPTPSLTLILSDSLGNKWASSTASLNVSSSGYKTVNLLLSPNTKPAAQTNYVLTTASFVGGTGSISADSLWYRDTRLSGPAQALISRTSASSAIISIAKIPSTIQIDYYLQVT